MRRLRVFLLSCGWDAGPLEGIPSIKFGDTSLYTWVERGILRVCLWPALKPEPLGRERRALTMRQCRFLMHAGRGCLSVYLKELQ